MSSEPPTKSARQACYSARDAFYNCVREQGGLEWTAQHKVPSKCKAARAAFEKECLPSWVKHFDTQQEVSARRARQLRAAIDSQATSAAGSLSGKAA
mmetsp:Transcript_17063/g.47261  ORF Transcript_17063/g.47261 Transcript_17063/m.47261 type:complete len:97 (+) Transcript_17063:131-421(+)